MAQPSPAARSTLRLAAGAARSGPTRASRLACSLACCWRRDRALLAVQPAHPLADVIHYKFGLGWRPSTAWLRFYSGVYPESYAIYPPVTLYALALVGHLYQAVVDPSFDLKSAVISQWLTTAIRLVALSMHLVLGAVLYRLAAPPRLAARHDRCGGVFAEPRRTLGRLGLGQPDSWHSLFSVLGLWSAGGGLAARSGFWLALAACTKPQAWLVVPLGAVGLLRRSGLAAWLKAGLAAAAVVLVVLMPFLVAGACARF